DASQEELFQKRSSVEECFEYIVTLMDEAIPDLKERALATDFGQVDQVVAKAIKAKVLVYRASPFFNGNKEYFGDFVNQDGEPFFPLEYNNEKWKDAIDAIDEALDACYANGIRLFTYDKQPYVFDREDYSANQEKLQLLYDLRMVVAEPWNTELIWGYSNIDIYNQGELAHSSNIRLPEGYGGGVTNTAGFSWQWMGATYRMAERQYTANGAPSEKTKACEMSDKS